MAVAVAVAVAVAAAPRHWHRRHCTGNEHLPAAGTSGAETLASAKLVGCSPPLHAAVADLVLFFLFFWSDSLDSLSSSAAAAPPKVTTSVWVTLSVFSSPRSHEPQLLPTTSPTVRLPPLIGVSQMVCRRWSAGGHRRRHRRRGSCRRTFFTQSLPHPVACPRGRDMHPRKRGREPQNRVRFPTRPGSTKHSVQYAHVQRSKLWGAGSKTQAAEVSEK